MNRKEAEEFLESFSNTSSFDGFINLISEASKKGFCVIPYSKLKSLKKGKRDKKEYGAVVVGTFKDDVTGEMMEVASNPVLKLKKR